MCTSANKDRKNFIRTARNYLIISAVTTVFGAVYELFSHGVWSYFMVYAFAAPLALGALPSVFLALREVTPAVSRTARKFYRVGLASLTLGMIFAGVIEISGTDSYLTKYYFIAAAALFTAAALVQVLTSHKE